METRSQLLCLASYWLDHNPKKVLYNKLPNKLPFRISSPPQPSGASCPHPWLSWRVTVLATASGCKPAAPRLLSPAAEVTVETEPCLAEAEVTWVVVYTTHTCALTRACGDREQPQVLHQLSYLPSLGLFLLFLNIYLYIYYLVAGHRVHVGVRGQPAEVSSFHHVGLRDSRLSGLAASVSTH